MLLRFISIECDFVSEQWMDLIYIYIAEADNMAPLGELIFYFDIRSSNCNRRNV